MEEEERVGLHEETIPSLPGPRQGGRPSDTQRRHLHAMISLLRPEDTVKLVRISQRTRFATLPFYARMCVERMHVEIKGCESTPCIYIIYCLFETDLWKCLYLILPVYVRHRVMHMQRHMFCNVVSEGTLVCSIFCYAEMSSFALTLRIQLHTIQFAKIVEQHAWLLCLNYNNGKGLCV